MYNGVLLLVINLICTYIHTCWKTETPTPNKLKMIIMHINNYSNIRIMTVRTVSFVSLYKSVPHDLTLYNSAAKNKDDRFYDCVNDHCSGNNHCQLCSISVLLYKKYVCTICIWILYRNGYLNTPDLKPQQIDWTYKFKIYADYVWTNFDGNFIIILLGKIFY